METVYEMDEEAAVSACAPLPVSVKPQVQAEHLIADEVMVDTDAENEAENDGGNEDGGNLDNDEEEETARKTGPAKVPKNVWEQAALAESGESEGWESSEDEEGRGSEFEDDGDEGRGAEDAVGEVEWIGEIKSGAVAAAIEEARMRVVRENRYGTVRGCNMLPARLVIIYVRLVLLWL